MSNESENVHKTMFNEIEPAERLELLEKQNYTHLKLQCQKAKTLFEDDLFPAQNTSFYCKDPKIELKWLRPLQVKGGAKFCHGLTFPAKLNISQGELGNPWFPGVFFLVANSKQTFEQIVSCEQTFSAPEYAGIFSFRLWYYGKWLSIVVDDRLPTIEGQLVMAHEKSGNYFVVSLLEKAYAKLVGCYEALGGSNSSEALEDFTGGLCESYLLKGRETATLFTVIYKSILHSSLVSCYLEAEEKQPVGKQLENGLCLGHCYVISAVNSIELEDETNQIQLIRMRNMFTNTAEWKGDWGPKSREWSLIPESDKALFGLSLENEGEFWMTYDSFKANFSKIDICNLNRFSSKYKWESTVHEGHWEPGASSGGCSTKGPYWSNPRFSLTVTAKDSDPDDPGGLATVVIGLMQKNRSSKKTKGLFDLKIGFQIYQTDGYDANNLPLQFFNKNKPVGGTKCYINLRQVLNRCRLKPGGYLVVPSTYSPNQKGSFLLRIYQEIIDRSIDADITYSLKPCQAMSLTNKNGLFKAPVGQINVSGNFSALRLHQFLKANIACEQNVFSIDNCQLLVSMYDERKDGLITSDQLRQLLTDLSEYHSLFFGNLKSTDGRLRQEEIGQCFDQMGVYAGSSLIRIILNRYGTLPEKTPTGQDGKVNVDRENETEQPRSIEFTDFTICAVKLRATILLWETKTQQEQGTIRSSKRTMVFTLREFVEQMMLM